MASRSGMIAHMLVVTASASGSSANGFFNRNFTTLSDGADSSSVAAAARRRRCRAFPSAGRWPPRRAPAPACRRGTSARRAGSASHSSLSALTVVAFDHLRLRLEIVVLAIQRVEHQEAVVARHVGGGPHRIGTAASRRAHPAGRCGTRSAGPACRAARRAGCARTPAASRSAIDCWAATSGRIEPRRRAAPPSPDRLASRTSFLSAAARGATWPRRARCSAKPLCKVKKTLQPAFVDRRLAGAALHHRAPVQRLQIGVQADPLQACRQQPAPRPRWSGIVDAARITTFSPL